MFGKASLKQLFGSDFSASTMRGDQTLPKDRLEIFFRNPERLVCLEMSSVRVFNLNIELFHSNLWKEQ